MASCQSNQRISFIFKTLPESDLFSFSSAEQKHLRCRSHLDGDDRLQLFVLDLNGLGGSLSVKLSVGHHGADDVTHTCHLQRGGTRHQPEADRVT